MMYLSRRSLLAYAGLAFLGSVEPQSRLLADDVVWLSDVQRPPDRAPSARRTLTPLLVAADGKPIKSLEDWRDERRRLRKAWLDFL